MWQSKHINRPETDFFVHTMEAVQETTEKEMQSIKISTSRNRILVQYTRNLLFGVLNILWERYI